MVQGIESVGVLGLGVMGFDIAFLYAMKGYRTLAYDAFPTVMGSLPDRIEKTIERLKRRDRIGDQEVANVRQCFVAASDLKSMARLDLVTEAVSEIAKTKISVYEDLTRVGFNGILTTNTSSLPRAALLAGKAYDREKFATTHFFNPVLYTRMVEVVKGDMESGHFDRTLSFLKSLGRKPVETKDISGFVSNSLLMYYAIMALHLLQHGAGIDQVDEAAKHLGLLPPFTSFDSWKPSIVEDVTRVMYEFRGDAFLRSSKLLPDLARANPRFYTDQQPNPEIHRRIGARETKPNVTEIKAALKSSIQVAAARVVELGEDPANVDFIATEGIKIPEGPLKEIDKIGADVLLEELKKIVRNMPEAGLTAPQLLIDMANQRQTFYTKDGHINSWIDSYPDRHTTHASH